MGNNKDEKRDDGRVREKEGWQAISRQNPKLV
jgi:hypothetical protein